MRHCTVQDRKNKSFDGCYIVLCIALSVSLTHFPRGIPRRKEEVSLIRQQYFRPSANVDIYGRRSPIHSLRNARYAKRHEARFRTIHEPGYYKNRRHWSKVFENPVEMDGVVNPCEPFVKSCLTEDLTPGTYMVQVEPESESDCDSAEGTCTIERRQESCAKCYYLFERKPFKVKFLNYVPTPCEEDPSRLQPSMPKLVNDISVKITMPPFQCIPPECREVVFCKYFQCTSLGFFPDSRNCRKYFFCDLNSNGFVLYHMLCPKGRIFDPIIRECRLKEMMNKRDIQRCRLEAAKLRRSEKMRIKKNDYEDLIKYKTGPELDVRRNFVRYSPKGRWRRRRLYRRPGDRFEARRNATMQRGRDRNMMNQPDFYMWHNPQYRKKMWMNDATPFTNNTKPFTIPKYCEMYFTMTPTTTTTESALPATTESTSTPTTMQTTSSETPTTETTSTTMKTTLPMCSPPTNKTNQSTKEKNYLGELDSDTYQEDMQDYDYGSYYDGDYAPEGDYDWLRKGLIEYLDRLQHKKGRKSEKDKNGTKYMEQSTPAQQKDQNENQNQQKEQLPPLTNQQTDSLTLDDSDRGKRSREKSSSTTVADQTDSSTADQSLPDFETSYKEEKSKNLDGYPCKEYARYPDKFDNVCYYECGAQPDGNMKVEHKCCPKGEEFSPQYLECVATEFLKMSHPKRSAQNQWKGNKKPLPEPDDNYDEDKDIPNEWLDASHTNKVPNEFKAKMKNSLRIFHLQCRRNSTEADQPHDRKHNIRSFTVRSNKKDAVEEPDDNDDEEYDDEEDYEDEDERSTGEIETTSEKSTPMESSSTAAATTNKVLLDADIHVGKEFENTLKNILGKTREQEKDQTRNDKDSILIKLTGNKPRIKRNFLKGIFSKKSKNTGDYPDKEGVVSMETLINGLPSEYERDALLQKLERRKMTNSHLFRSREGKRKRKKSEGVDENLYRNAIRQES